MGAEAASPRTPGAGARPGAGGGDFSPAPVGGDFGGLLPWGAPPPRAGGGPGGGEGGDGEQQALARALTSGLGAAGAWVLGAAAGGPQQPPPQSPGAVGRSVQHIVRQHAEAVATTRARCQELETEAQTLRERVSARGSQLSDLRAEVGGLRAKLQRAGVSPLRASSRPPRPVAEILSPDRTGKGLEGAFAGAASVEEDEGLWRTAAGALEVELRGAREEAATLLRECEVLREEAASRKEGGGGAKVGEQGQQESAAAAVPPAAPVPLERNDNNPECVSPAARATDELERRALEASAAVKAAQAAAVEVAEAGAEDLARLAAERDEWEARAGDLLREVEELRSSASCPQQGVAEAERASELERWEFRVLESEAASKAAAEAAAEELARLTAERDEWEAKAGDLLTDLEALQATAEIGARASDELQLQAAKAEAASQQAAKAEAVSQQAAKAEAASQQAAEAANESLARLTAERDEWRARAGDLLTDLEALQSAGSDVAQEAAAQERQTAEVAAAAAAAAEAAAGESRRLAAERDEWEVRAGGLLTDLEELQGEITELQAAREEASALRARLDQALEDSARQGTELTQANAAATEARGATGQLLSDLRQQERKNEALGGCVAALETKLEDKRRAAKRLQDLVGEAHASLQTLRAGKEEVERALGSWQERCGAAEAESERLAVEMAEKTEQAAAELEAGKAEVGRLATALRERMTPEQERALAQRVVTETEARRRIHNELQDYKGAIRVFCRVRPFLPPGQAGGGGAPAEGERGALEAASREGVRLEDPMRGASYQFTFDRVFGPDVDQAGVFSEISGLVQSVLDGYNVCIFSYGQTGSGKTHTMMGTREDPGVNVRSLHALFKLAQERSEAMAGMADGKGGAGPPPVSIAVSVLEIYNETLRDLLVGEGRPEGPAEAAREAPPKLEIRNSGDPGSGAGSGVHVPGLTVRAAESLGEVLSLLEAGERNRAQACTNLNEHSSRSHALVSINVAVRPPAGGGPARSAKLHLVDLAGSERVARSHATGAHMKEAQSINRSLSMLGDIVAALQRRASHVPYRNSRLTHLLSDSLGGGAKVAMFVNCSPRAEDVPETLSSLQFADKVKRVELGRARKAHEPREGAAPGGGLPPPSAGGPPKHPRPPLLARPEEPPPSGGARGGRGGLSPGPSPRGARSPAGTPTGSIFAPS